MGGDGNSPGVLPSTEDLIECAARGIERAAARSAVTGSKLVTLDSLVPGDGSEMTLREWILVTNARLWSAEQAARAVLALVEGQCPR